MAFNRYILLWKTSIIDVWLAYKSFLSRISTLINYTMWSSNLLSAPSSFFFLSAPAFFIVQVFQNPDFSGSRFFWDQVFKGPDFFWVRVSLGPGFSWSGSRIWVQVLEVANQNSFVFNKIYFHYITFFHDIKIYFYSIKINLYSIKYIFIISLFIMTSKYSFLQSK